MQPFCLGQPFDLGGKSTYLGGLEEGSQALPLDFNWPSADFVVLLSSDDSGNDETGVRWLNLSSDLSVSFFFQVGITP